MELKQTEEEIYRERNKNYYPLGLTINDVRECIKGVSGFRESIRDDTIVFNYDSLSDESFPDPLSEPDQKKQFLLRCRRECRGLIFDLKTEKLLCRKLHKFFNINEFKEVKAEFIDLNEPYILMDKIDGSLIAPMLNKGQVYWGSKQGISDLGTMLNDYVNRIEAIGLVKYNDFSMKWIQLGYTPLFEYSSSKQQIILYYGEERLRCLALRNNHTGEYLKWRDLQETCTAFNVPMVDLIDTTSDQSLFKSCKSTIELVELIKQMKLIEGCVLKFENSGKMYKIKTEWYITLARLSLRSPKVIKHEKDVWAILLSGHYDDVKETIKMITNENEEPSEKIQKIEKFSKILFDRIDLVSQGIILTIIDAKKNQIQKKLFHNHPVQNNLTDSAKTFSYQYWEIINENDTLSKHLSLVSKQLMSRIKNLTNSNSKLETARSLLGLDINF
ncbi:hypothetical protein ACTFIW_013059 [Dictyostelium discoideum]